MSHHDHPTEEKKPVAFTVPFILASVTVLVLLMFLSLCDPKPHHGMADCEDKENCSKECMDSCEKAEHGAHHKGKAAHTMTCSECKSECSEDCMEACMHGDHSKHKTPETKKEEATPAKTDSTASPEPVHH